MSYENLQISRKGSRAVFFKRNMPKATADFDRKTVSLLPELAGYGENLICDSVRQYFCGKKEVQLFYQTRFYDTDRQRKWSDWGLSGCVLKIKDSCIKGQIYCYKEKVYQRILPAGYSKAGKLKGFQVYSADGNYKQHELDTVLGWLEENLCGILSYMYAVNLQEGVMEIIFRDLELYPVEVIGERIMESMKK